MAPIRWAIVVLAFTLSAWNYLNYRQEAISYPPSAWSEPIATAEPTTTEGPGGISDLASPDPWAVTSHADPMLAQEAQKMRLRHIEWEVLILGLGLAAWLISRPVTASPP